MPLDIREDDLKGPEIRALLETHLTTMAEHSPPESVHALDLDALRAPDITFWSVYDGETLAGCGALRRLTATHGEIKSMHTKEDLRGKGVAGSLVEYILAVARSEGLERLSLETGRLAPFASAQLLYRKFDFKECPPFGDYQPDPFSMCMTLDLTR